MELRMEILENSLNVESLINGLIVHYLSLSEVEKSRNFSNKRSIPFQSKIDLLYDFKIFNKDEIFAIELVMFFRNKFLHVSSHNSFSDIFINYSSKKNELKKFSDSKMFEDENDYLQAYRKLQIIVVDIIKNKFIIKLDERKRLGESIITHVNNHVKLRNSIFDEVQVLSDNLNRSLLGEIESSEFHHLIFESIKNLFSTLGDRTTDIFEDETFIKKLLG